MNKIAKSQPSSLKLGFVDIWLAQPLSDPTPEALLQLESVLSRDEVDRYRRFHFERDQQLYLTAHVLLRTRLSQYVDLAPTAWSFEFNGYGKPEIADGLASGSQLRFNLSHTRGLAACAFVRSIDLGVDVESLDRERATLGIADRYFSKRETRQLKSLPTEKQQQGFVEYWTLKEAFVKACGRGLSIPLEDFSFRRDRDGVWNIDFDGDLDAGQPGDWQFDCMRVPPNHLLAYALRRGPHPDYQVRIRRATEPLFRHSE